MRHALTHATVAVLAMFGATALTAAAAPEPEVTLTFAAPELAGISGFRAMWDTPLTLAESGPVETVARHVGGGLQLAGPAARWFPEGRAGGTLPGTPVFDAVHRSLLVRFPGLAGQVAARVNEGYRIARAELVLPFRNTELWPEGYHDPTGMSFLRDEWVRTPPAWHAVGWALRRPWRADPAHGPTFNAHLNGAGFWARFGAQDEAADRFPQRFGPTEVSYREAGGYRADAPVPAPVADPKTGALATPDTAPGGTPARMDVTAALTDPAFGKTLAARLRQFEDCGLLLRKWEVYDARYHTGTYEWSTATGRRGILIRAPRLEVTLTADPAAERVRRLPPPADIADLATRLSRHARGGQPTANLPSAAEIARFAARFGFRRPEWMPDWQWDRVQELKRLGGGWDFPATPAAYAAWIDDLLATPPRQWLGHATPRKAINAMRFHDALPEVVREHEQNYFAAWVMPGVPSRELDHPQAIAMWYGGRNRHWEQTRDWRGNQSYYRAGYTRRISTQNINHLGTAGALFGGALVGSEDALADGRYGLEYFPLRLWAWYDGTSQESVDHYYMQLTLWTEKEFAEFGPAHLDRMMGGSMLAKMMDELLSTWHPGLRRFVSSSCRTDLQAVLLTRTGLHFLLHTLSPQGVLAGLDEPNRFGIAPLNATEMPPGYVADETLLGPWAPAWAAHLVDDKPLPYELTESNRVYGQYERHPAWKRTYLGRHYGLTSRDLDFEEAYHFVQAMAQWRREDRPAAGLADVVTLLVRPEADQRHANWYGGRQWTDTPPLGGLNHNVQYRNKLIALTSPVDMRGKVAPATLQSTLQIFNFQEPPTWEIFIDGQPVRELPCTARAGQRITIRDGVSYVGVVPVPATDLGRDAEVVLAAGLTTDIKECPALPGLTIRSFMLRRGSPLDKGATDWDRVDRAYGGFVIELGDCTEYADFAAFQAHMQAATLESRWDDVAGIVHLVYRSGADTMELGYNPGWREGSPEPLFPYRRVNGAWAYLPAGLDRDSTLTQQGTTGRLEKGGAVLQCEPGRMAYLQTEPRSATFVGFNPLPDPTCWRLTLPGGQRVEADGRLSLTRVEVQPEQGRVAIDYAAKPDQAGDDMASALLLFGFGETAPAVTVNGQEPQHRLASTRTAAGTAWLVPLTERGRDRSRVALLRLDLSAAEGAIALELPPQEQDLIAQERATALLVFGATQPPRLTINGAPYTGEVGTATVSGQAACVFPLFGTSLEAALAGLDQRYAQARTRLPPQP